MTLEELLTRTGAVDAPSPDLLGSYAEAVATAARAEIARRAVLVRRRRIARFGSAAVGLTAAAAIVGVVALEPSAHAPSEQVRPPVSTPVSPHFKTVAQVVNAAAVATPNVDPTATAYWKVVLRQYVQGCGVTQNSCSMQASTYTIWNGLGRPGVVQTVGGDAAFGPTALPADPGLLVRGRLIPWPEANTRHWTPAELASLVADDAAPGEPGRPRAEWYIFKNTADLLMTSPAGADLRKQLWRYLATVEGAKLDGQATDALGRRGWKISYKLAGYGAQSFLVDPTTGQLLESRTVLPGQTEAGIGTLISAGPSDSAPTLAPSPDLRIPGGDGRPLKPAPGTSSVPPVFKPQS